MRTGHGIFFQYDNGRTVCVAAVQDFTEAQRLYSKLHAFLDAREAFGATPEMTKDPDDRKLFEHFERLEKRLGSGRVLRSGTGEILLYIKEA